MLFFKWYYFLVLVFITDYCETKKSFLVIRLGNDDLGKALTKNILRDALGDACLKVAIRKCYKALLKVKERFCLRYKCQSVWKTDFIRSAKHECLKEFDYTNYTKQNDSTTTTPKPYEPGKNESTKTTIPYEGSTKFLDATREGFLKTCLPQMINQYKKKGKTLRHNRKSDMLKTILRQSSDKQCRDLSREKCTTACNNVKKFVCLFHLCNFRKRSVFERICRNECKLEYTDNKKYDYTDTSYSSDSDSSSYSRY